MSEVQPRSYGSRGRGSFRGGRGGYRGTRNGSKTHAKSEDLEGLQPASVEDQGEVGELKKKFGNKVSSLREVCEGWSDEDLVYALKETDGDVNMAFDRILSGSISQWGEVKKKQPKAKDAPASHTETSTSGRGGRGRGNFEARGRGRGAERSRAGRGGRGASQANGTKSSEKTSKTTGDGWGETAGATEATGGWDTTGNGEAGQENVAPTGGDWAHERLNDHDAVPAAEQPKTEGPPTAKPSTWSKLFAPPPPAPKKAPAPVPVSQPEETLTALAIEQHPPTERLPPPIESQAVEDISSQLPEAPHPDTPTNITPSKDELTETNLERLPDVSRPPASATAASTVASTQDPLSTLNLIPPALRPGMSGYAASALKATSGAGRSASFTRRVMEQQEAVIMPGNHAVDRAAVQFGSMGLNGLDDADVDDEREEPETRTQLPDDSPAAPRASLPPIHHEVESTAPTQTVPEQPQAQRQAPGLPPVQHQMPSSSSPAQAYPDQYRYGPTGPKGYDPFGQQQSQPQPAQPTQAQSLEPFANQVPNQSHGTPQNEYSSYYGAGNSREAYQNYYGAYGQPQETQQRSGSAAFGTSAQDTQGQYATSRPQQTYSQQDAQHSGHNTPNPTIPGHQAQHSQHMPQHPGGYGGYPHGYANNYGQQYAQYGSGYGSNTRYGVNRPLFDDVRRQGGQETDYYPNQYAYGQNQQQYGGYNKSNIYAQPQQQYSYEHSSSPAATGGYGQSAMGGREAAYGRTGSAQPSESQQNANTAAYSGMSDPFGRSHSGFGQQQGSGEEPAKAYDAGKANGPSPAIGQAHRPGSAVNSMPGQQSGQSGSLPPPQSQQSTQQTFGGYPQYSGYGGGHQGQTNHPQNTNYGYGSNTAGFGSTYGGGYGSGRGWNGGNYGGSH